MDTWRTTTNTYKFLTLIDKQISLLQFQYEALRLYSMLNEMSLQEKGIRIKRNNPPHILTQEDHVPKENRVFGR